MSSEISASVGRWEKGARNLQDDVRTVQRLLKAAAEILEAPEIDPKGVDGEISRPPGTSDTVEAIEAFQSRFTSAVERSYCARQPDVDRATGSRGETANRAGKCFGRFSMAFPFSDCSSRELGRTASGICITAGGWCPLACRL